jgi:hypothetical protein
MQKCEYSIITHFLGVVTLQLFYAKAPANGRGFLLNGLEWPLNVCFIAVAVDVIAPAFGADINRVPVVGAWAAP